MKPIDVSDLLKQPIVGAESTPDLYEMVTNELAINRISLALNQLYGLPAAKYQLTGYGEEVSDNSIIARIHLSHENLRVVVHLIGPRIAGKAIWGLKVGEKSKTEVDGENGIKLIRIEGYLKPE